MNTPTQINSTELYATIKLGIDDTSTTQTTFRPM